jgi:hypothetical protein
MLTEKLKNDSFQKLWPKLNEVLSNIVYIIEIPPFWNMNFGSRSFIPLHLIFAIEVF